MQCRRHESRLPSHECYRLYFLFILLLIRLLLSWRSQVHRHSRSERSIIRLSCHIHYFTNSYTGLHLPTRSESYHEEDHSLPYCYVGLLHFLWSIVGTYHNNLGLRYYSTTTSTQSTFNYGLYEAVNFVFEVFASNVLELEKKIHTWLEHM
jgi:hypothetical protein